METIKNAIKMAVTERCNTGCSSTVADTADFIWSAAHEAMKDQGMFLLDKPVTTTMLHRQIEQTSKFEQALGDVAQELNEALGNFDYAPSREEAGNALKALVEAARLAVKVVEQANPNWPLYKQPTPTTEDVLWEGHLLRGTWPSDAELLAVNKHTTIVADRP